MVSAKTLACLTLVVLAIAVNSAEGAPFLWDFLYGSNSGWRTGRAQGRRNIKGDNFNTGDLCRILNPSNGWSPTGQFNDPNCPP